MGRILHKVRKRTLSTDKSPLVWIFTHTGVGNSVVHRSLEEALPLNEWRDVAAVRAETGLGHDDLMSRNELEYRPAAAQVRRIDLGIVPPRFRKVSKSDQQ